MTEKAMKRTPVCAMSATVGGSSVAPHIRETVVCSDGAVFCRAISERGEVHEWYQVSPIPGTDAEEKEKRND